MDAMPQITGLAREHGAWCHVDGAFGLWAAASPALRDLVEGVADADSWATDAHKLLNVPYDSGVAIVRDRAAHAAAMNSFAGAVYIPEPEHDERYQAEWVPEFSRRARGIAVADVPILVVLVVAVVVVVLAGTMEVTIEVTLVRDRQADKFLVEPAGFLGDAERDERVAEDVVRDAARAGRLSVGPELR